MISIDSRSLIISMVYPQISVSINDFVFYCNIASHDPLTGQDMDNDKDEDSCHLSHIVKVHDTLDLDPLPLLARATTSASTASVSTVIMSHSHPHSYHAGDTHSHSQNLSPHNQLIGSDRPNPRLQNAVALSDGDGGHHMNTYSLRLEPLNENSSSSSSSGSGSGRNAGGSSSGLLKRNLSLQRSEELETLRR